MFKSPESEKNVSILIFKESGNDEDIRKYTFPNSITEILPIWIICWKTEILPI